MNWRGRPLTSHEVIVNSIAATTTRTGLTVHAELDAGSLPDRGRGQRRADGRRTGLARHGFHGDWNYTIHPAPPRPRRHRRRRARQARRRSPPTAPHCHIRR